MALFSRPSSSAIKIVAPSAEEPASPGKASKKDFTQRQCRNILIYGSCKFQDKGCRYYHPSDGVPTPPESPVPSAALPAQAVNAPVFVPKTAKAAFGAVRTSADSSQTQFEVSETTASTLASMSLPTSEPQESNAGGQDYTDEQSELPAEEAEHYDQQDTYEPYSYGDDEGDIPGDGSQLNPYLQADMPPMAGFDIMSTMDPYFSSQFTFVRQPLEYHLYTQPRPESLEHKYFITDSIREELQKRSETIRTAPPAGLNLPEEIQEYHSLVPLEPLAGERHKFGNWYSAVYRAINSRDGATYVLRRVENFRLMQQSAFSTIEAWSRIRHPNIVSVREAFTTRAFGDSSLVVVYDYHPNAQTLFEAHIKARAPVMQNGRLQAQQNRIPERTLWSYIIQIGNAIKAVHDAGMAVSIIDATKVLVTGKNRVRLGSCGLVDVLCYETRAESMLLQQEDLGMFGRLILALACNNVTAMNNFPKAIETLARHYSADLKTVVLFLMSKLSPNKTIGHLFELIGSRLLTEMDEMQNAVDRLEGELMSELENARLVRLLCKFGFINERPEFAREPRWSETGDKYIIKLFRDYVFHQVDEHGNPVVNLSHVLTCLNKLDAGADERIMLISRDEQNCLVVSYKEIKSCIDSAFSELSKR